MTNKNPLSIFEPYLSDSLITDINYNGQTLWVDHLEYGRKECCFELTETVVMNACIRFSDCVNQHFNVQSPVLEEELNNIRVSIIHPSVAGKLSVSLRKSPAEIKIRENDVVKTGYISKSALKFLKYAVRCRANIMVSGLPGAGKTELIKFLTSFIDENSRVISIEDTRELHYDALHPQRDCVSLKVDNQFSYEHAIRASMRQRPNWLLVSEVRGQEVKDLIRSVSTGAHLLSTIHAKEAAEIPNRMMIMMSDTDRMSKSLLYQLHEAIDVGIHVEMIYKDERPVRFVREIVVFNQGESQIMYHYQKKRTLAAIPAFIKEKAELFGVKWQ